MQKQVAAVLFALVTGTPTLAITTYDVNVNNVAGPGTVTTGGVNLDGMAQVITSIGACSGALLAGGTHILTAAHCVHNGAMVGAATINFFTANGDFSFATSDIYVAPGWSGMPGTLLDGGDLAILALSSAFTGAQGYEIYRGSAEVGQSIEIAGWGRDGTGDTGYTGAYGTRRWGTNMYDATGALFSNSNSTILMADFDNGTATNDLFGRLVSGLANAALTDSNIAPGDSGGPSFWNGLLVGIHSLNGRVNLTPSADIDAILNASFGELFGDTRVSSHLAFIDSVTMPEPSTFGMGGLGLLLLISARPKRGRRGRSRA